MKYKHRPSGNIAVLTHSRNNYKVSNPQNYTIPKWIVENSSDWEEVIENPAIESALKRGYLPGVKVRCDFVGSTYEGTLVGPLYTTNSGIWSKIQESSLAMCICATTKKKWATILQEAHSEEWSIISFINNKGDISTLRSNGKYMNVKCSGDEGLISLSSALEHYHIWNIHSVRRNSDSEVFTVGDKIDSTISDLGRATDLTGFKIIDNKLKVGLRHLGYYPLSTIILPKQPLFTTEDGVDIFSGDRYYFTTEDLKLGSSIAGKLSGLYPSSKYFSTEAAANNHVDRSKPKYSLSHLERLSVWPDNEYILIQTKDLKQVP